MVRRSAVLLALLVLTAVIPLASSAQSALPAVPPEFTIERIATVPGARELAVAANGDLFAGTLGSTVVVITDAEGTPAPPAVFTRIDEPPVAGITLDGNRMIVGTQFGVWEVPYAAGQRRAASAPHRIAAVRTSGGSGSHRTTTVAVANGKIYASVGSSCNNCDPEVDATRASVLDVRDGAAPVWVARRLRNGIALAVNPATGTLWTGNAGQDELPHGHPYEIFDAVTLHAAPADYGWPHCYDDHVSVDGRSCAAVVVPRVVFPAYETPIGAVFYPLHPTGAYAFPDAYRGGAFVTLHGSWHQPPVSPRVAFVPMTGDAPRTPVDWHDPTKQWREFVSGLQRDDGSRLARPTGIAVGTDGSLFISADEPGAIYRIRPKR